MTRLILMRHGNTFEAGKVPVQIGSRTDLPLTAFGKEQARKMAQFLKNDPPEAIFAGGLKRQMESAMIIAEEFGLTVLPVPALAEIDYGLWEGLRAEEIAQKWPKEHAEWTDEAKWQSHIFQGSFEEHWQNLQVWLNSLLNQKAIFGVTSNGLLRLFRNEKVKTGHYCEFNLHPDRIEISLWNRPPNI